MSNLRLCVILVLIFATSWVYFFNVRFVAFKLLVFVRNLETEETEWWRHFGLETECKIFMKQDPHGATLDDFQAYRSNLLIRRHHSSLDLKTQSVNLNINASDVLVVIHIQKTGGTYLEDNLALNTNIQPPVRCKSMPGVRNRMMCTCVNNRGQDWMINRHCTGWNCGLHPGFMEMTACVDHWFSSQVNEARKRNYYYITMIRDPVTRFVSEWLHVRRGATWKESRLFCDGRDATTEEVPFCFKYGSWRNVTLDAFLNCSSNMAFNRQTRMLANLSLSDCYRLKSNLSWDERGEIMLQSAKDNLARYFTFFGLLEYIEESQSLFEKTFIGLKFKTKLSRKKSSYSTNYAVLSELHWLTIAEKNHLDVRLYQYAKDLLFQRLHVAQIGVSRLQNETMLVKEGFKFLKIHI